MRWAVRALILLLLLAVLALGGLAIALPRIASSEAVQARLQSVAREATGEEVRWDSLGVGLLPPRLVVSNPRLEGKASAPSKLRAQAVDLRIALLPLLARTVLIDSLVVEGVEARLVRTAQGIELPVRAPPSPQKEARERPPSEPTEEKPAAKAPLALAVRDLRLARSRLVLEDRSVSPPVTWEVSDLDARARGTSLDAPLELELSGSLASGGAFRVSGTGTLEGRVDLELSLDGVRLDNARPYLPEGGEASGTVSGTVRARGPAASPDTLEARLSLGDARMRLEDVRLEGELALRADLTGGLEAPAGDFEIDATGATLEYGEALKKPRGERASVGGRIVPRTGSGLAIEGLSVRFADLDAKGSLQTGERTRLELEAPPFAVDRLGAMSPDLAELSPGGRVSLQKLSVQTAPLDLRGRVGIEEMRLRPPGRDPVVLVGALEGAGSSVVSRDLVAKVAEQSVGLQVDLLDLEGSPRYRIRASTSQADVNALLAALAGMPDTLSGPLDATADLSGPIGGEAEPVEAVSGRTRLDIGQGRLRGVSLLRGTVERLGAFGDAAVLLGAARGGSSLQRFYDDEFESIAGTFEIANGRARTEDLRLVYRNYRVDLRGALGLLDESLDLTGKLTIDEEVDAALAPEGTAEPATPPPPPRQKVIPLAHVGGTLGAPRVDLSRDAVVAFASSFAVDKRRGEIERKIDERLGEGSGREILDTLEGILGGGQRREANP